MVFLHEALILTALAFYAATASAEEECRTLKEPEHGTIHYSIMDDTIYAQLQCSGGYVITGCAVTTCSGSTGGTWKQEIPHCRAVECMELDNPANGRVNFPVPTVYGSEAVYTCETGHVLAGNSSRRCQIDGTWSESHPTCIAVACKELDDPLNGRVQSPIPPTYPSEAVYTCSAGHTLQGQSTRECLSDGVWSGTQPQCVAALKEPNEVDCGKPSDVEGRAGVTVFDDTVLHSKVKYSCKNQRCNRLQGGSSVATCTDTGVWSNHGNPPQCTKRKFNPRKFELPGELKLQTRGMVECGDQVTVQCPPGYQLAGAKHGTVVSRSVIRWKGKLPSCK